MDKETKRSPKISNVILVHAATAYTASADSSTLKIYLKQSLLLPGAVCNRRGADIHASAGCQTAAMMRIPPEWVRREGTTLLFLGYEGYESHEPYDALAQYPVIASASLTFIRLKQLHDVFNTHLVEHHLPHLAQSICTRRTACWHGADRILGGTANRIQDYTVICYNMLLQFLLKKPSKYYHRLSCTKSALATKQRPLVTRRRLHSSHRGFRQSAVKERMEG